jgi:kinesin family protein 1
MSFSLDVAMQIRPRSYIRQASMFQQLLGTQRIVHSTVGLFAISLQPMSAKRAADLWRMSTAEDYVKGEEQLHGWTPRGISLIQDYMKCRKQKQRVADVETARSVLSLQALAAPNGAHASSSTSTYTEQQESLLHTTLALWTKPTDIADSILTPTNLSPPQNGAAFATTPAAALSAPTLVPSVRPVPKNPSLLKSGYLLTPDETHTRWVRRFVELRRPYLHVYSVPDGDELAAVNLSNSRVDHEPQLALLLRRSGPGAAAPAANVVWAVFAPQNSFLFKARSERDKVEWILKIDESYFSSASASSGSSSANGE